MLLVWIVLVASVLILAGYVGYGSLLARLFRLDAKTPTPAVQLRDDVDYVPIDSKFLFGQHFSAIAAAGPIVGPILAGIMFGWLPALIWIVLGSIFIGGVHDMGSLIASVRHKARSIAEVVREHMNRRSYVLFLVFVWIALVYIIVAFTDMVAASFVGRQTLENGIVVAGAGIATSSLMYLALPLIMGLLMRYAKLPVGVATLIFLPLVGVAIWAGPYLPFNLAGILGISDGSAQKVWGVILLVYCYVASVVPMWLLLQPRGHLGGYFLLVALVGGALGLVLGGQTVQYPAFVQWTTGKGETLFPFLFITIACGACSGFHSLVATGTTSKQLRVETDAKPVAYGGMLLEGLVAVVSLACVMMLAPGSALLAGSPKPNLIYGVGLGSFLEALGIPATFAISFSLLAFTTFVYDTLDVATRLGRYILQELTGWQGRTGRWAATAITAATPLLFVMQRSQDPSGNMISAWRIYWPVFGASNQLMAALALLGITVWLWRTRRVWWVWPVVGLPTVWMYAMSTWSLAGFIHKGFFAADGSFKGMPTSTVPWVAAVLILLAGVLFIEAIRTLASARGPAAPAPDAA